MLNIDDKNPWFSKHTRPDGPGPVLPPCGDHPHAGHQECSDQQEEQKVRYAQYLQIKIFVFRKYGAAWDEYSGKVRANIVPLVF